MRRSYYDVENSYEKRIRHLEEELDESRYSIVRLMPGKIQEVLRSFYDCESRKETHGWENETALEITEFAEILNQDGGLYFSDQRAYCPLCGDGSSSYSTEGFTVPEGLRRHLVGSGAQQCDVFKAAEKLAIDYWHRKFSEAEEAEEIEKKKIIAERKKTEILYKTDAYNAPQLIDEIGFGGTVRNEDELLWAENRVTELGFQISLEANIKSYLNDRQDFIVYADPREKGEIKFKVFKKPLPKKSRKLFRGNSFTVKDSWKHDLVGKYTSRLEKAIVYLEK